MQDEVNTKVVAIAIKGGKITAEVLDKRQFSLQHPSIQQCCKNLQKGALNLSEIQHED